MEHWSRHQFVPGVGAAALVLVAGCRGLPSQTQQPANPSPPSKVPRIGVLNPDRTPVAVHLIEVFEEGLREYGWIDGETLAIEYCYSQGRDERYAELAAEMD